MPSDKDHDQQVLFRAPRSLMRALDAALARDHPGMSRNEWFNDLASRTVERSRTKLRSKKEAKKEAPPTA